MPNSNQPKHVEYMCSHCGAKVVRPTTSGKPMPSKCPKRTNNQPHVWTINRKW